jgi:hypothetical protein
VHVVATFLEKAEPQPFNAALLIDAAGRTLSHHRKVHICDFDSPELACGRGSGFAACDIDTGAGRVRLGLFSGHRRSPRRGDETRQKRTVRFLRPRTILERSGGDC